MALNTVKTTFGFLATLLRKVGILRLDSPSLERIYNYVPISEMVSTSGQPSEADLRLIKNAGFRTIVNLAPHNAENSLPDERQSVDDLELDYIHIPVDFKNPTDADFERFVEVMGSLDSSKVWVHCAANMRVSAFMYRYRCTVLGEKEEIAAKDMAKIWEPFGVWSSFVKQTGNDT